MFPIIFSANFFELHTLWVFFAIALIVSTVVLIRLALSNGLKVQFLSTNAWKIIIWAVIGARIWSIINNYSNYFSEINLPNLLRLFYFWDKGLELWGAIIAALICLYILCKKNEQNFWKWLDVIIPATILGLAIGSIGTFFDGTNYGTPSSLPWAVNFDNAAIKYSVPIHPTQIYAFLYSSITFSILIFLGQNQKIKNMERSGLVGLLGIAIFCFFHFLEEFVRGDDALTILDIRIAQITSLIALIGAITIIYTRFFKKRSRLHSKQI